MCVVSVVEHSGSLFSAHIPNFCCRGRSTVQLFVLHGARVIVLDRDPPVVPFEGNVVLQLGSVAYVIEQINSSISSINALRFEGWKATGTLRYS